MEKTNDNYREIDYINTAKALGIIAVVIGHTDSPPVPYVYLYHMALFFFISGYLYKDYYTERPFQLIKKRIRSLYLPYIKYELLYLALNNLFFRFHLIGWKYSGQDFLTHFKNIMTMNGNEQLAGAFWFFVSLFTVNLLFCAISWVCSRFFEEHMEDARLIMVSACFILGNLLVYKGIQYSRFFDTSLVAMLIFYTGYLYRKNESLIKMKFAYALVAVIFLVTSKLYGHIEMVINYYVNPAYFVMNSITGIIKPTAE